MKIANEDAQLLVLEWGNLGKLVLGVCMLAVGLAMVPSLKENFWGTSHAKGGIVAVLAAFGFGVVLLGSGKQRYTFDRRIGQLTVESKGLWGQSHQALSLSQIKAIGLKRTRNQSEGTTSKWAYQVELLLNRDGIGLPLQIPPLQSAAAADNLAGKICALLDLEPPTPALQPPVPLSERAIPLPLVLLLIALVIFAFGFLVWKGMH